MPLSPGTRLGPYEIHSPLGAGGMGEVYKARDTRLDRTIAIKVLPEHVASDPELRQRFEREAKALAALSHPHICPVFDVGHHPSTHSASSGQAGSGQAHSTSSGQGVDYLVMEYLEGETLAQRLAKGALPIDQALQVAIQIADALDKAHRKGIVHRDLKPGNIMLTKAGAGSASSPQAKLLDFGLAKLRPASASGAGGLSEAPTVSSPFGAAQGEPITGQGTILGTFQYMAPEQLEGQEADARTDIFAFGAVVYEMVTGKKAFEGKSQASLISAIMSREPQPMGQLQTMTPPALDHVVARCLAKAPDDRWQTARDLHQELRWVLDQPSIEPKTAPGPVSRFAPGWRTVGPAAAVFLVVGAALMAVVFRLGTEAPAPALVTRLEAAITPAASLVANAQQPQVGISPDGRAIAFRGRLPGESTDSIFVRRLDAEGATALPGAGTDTSFGPVFSPDGAWVAYQSLEGLFKVPVNGGRPTSLVRYQGGFVRQGRQGLSWSVDDWIYYSEPIGRTGGGGISRVQAGGGEPERLTTTVDTVVAWPQVIGDGRFVIFSELPINSGIAWDGAQIMLLDTQTGNARVLVETGGVGATATASGHLVFVRGGSLFAAPFDPGRLEVTGTAREVLAGIQYDPTSGTTQYAIAGNGTLVYQPGAPPGTRLMWADTRGAIQAFSEEHVYQDPRLSPDGRAVAVEVVEGGDDIWVLDLVRGTQTKLSLSSDEDETPAWSPDGQWVAWSTNRDGQRVIVRKRADGSGREEVLWSGPDHTHVSMYTPDGRSLLFEKQTAEGSDIWLVPLDGSGTERIVVGSASSEFDARLSPDGRWLAYASDEAGISQVYVQPFPGLDARFPISPSGGAEPVWARDGRRLFYRSNGTMWAVSIEPGETFEAGLPQPLFEDRYGNKGITHTGYDVGRDGRFLVIGSDSPQNETMTVILNWTEELKRLVPVN